MSTLGPFSWGHVCPPQKFPGLTSQYPQQAIEHVQINAAALLGLKPANGGLPDTYAPGKLNLTHSSPFSPLAKTWRAESDKTRSEHTTPLTQAAVQAARLALREQTAIGDSWVFPSPKFSNRPCSAHTLSKWMQQARKAAGLGERRGYGYHSFRRKFGTDLKDQGVALRDTMALGGWKDSKTLLDCYQHTDVESMRNALDRRPNPLTNPLTSGLAEKDGAS